MSCSSCRIDLSATTFIHCAECVVPSVSMCILCFSGRFETIQHKCDHDYYVLHGDSLQGEMLLTNLVPANLLILEHVRRTSLGAWGCLSDRLAACSLHDVEKSVMSIYNMWKRGTVSSEGYKDAISTNALECFSTPSHAEMMLETIPATAVAADIPGFLPKRKDFELEYDDTAELAIADLEFYENDTEQDFAVKCTTLQTLNERLRRRETIKDYVINTGMVCARDNLEGTRVNSNEQTEVQGKLRPIHRFFDDPHQLNDFISLCLYEARLKAKLNALDEGDVLKSEDTMDIEDNVSSLVRRYTNGESAPRKSRVADTECSKVSDLVGTEQVVNEVIELKRNNDQAVISESDTPAIELAFIEEFAVRKLHERGYCSGEVIVAHQKDFMSVNVNGIQ